MTVPKEMESLVPATGELVQASSVDLSLARAPERVLEEAKAAAVALKRVLEAKAKPVIINREQYLEFEDWQTCGRFYGVTAKVVSTNPVAFDQARGFEARAVAILTATGMEISAGEAMCLNDEPRWADRPLFQLRSMAQTRACAKALRNVLAWVVVLAGYRPTPAEEMDGHQPTATPATNSAPKTEAAPPSEGGSIYVTNVEAQDGIAKPRKDGTGGGRPYRLFRVTFSDGQMGSTFDVAVGELAMKMREQHQPCDRTLTPGRREGTWDLTELQPAADSVVI